jgi:CubicO group peptidase (beta-lactamase class C family)
MNIANIAYNDELLDGPPETAPIPAGEPLRGLPRSAPEAQGVSSEGIREFIVAADQVVKTMHSFMLLRHGYVVAEAWWKPEATEKPHVMWSLSKSFTSTAIGMAVEEGLLSIDDLVVDFFPEQVPTDASSYLKAMRGRRGMFRKPRSFPIRAGSKHFWSIRCHSNRGRIFSTTRPRVTCSRRYYRS